MPDALEHWGKTLVHHGPENDRIYLLKVHPEDMSGLRERVDALLEEKGYGKVIAKVPLGLSQPFLEAGYREEARIPGLYQGREDGLFLVRYASRPGRDQEPFPEEVSRVRRRLDQDTGRSQRGDLQGAWVIRRAGEDDLPEMAQLYRQVFPSYPFPIDDPEYLRETMKGSVRYTGAWRSGRLLALASVEMDVGGQNAEMTDFATLPEGRGKGLALNLLKAGEEIARQEGLLTLYTIARAPSVGMNLTFKRAGYRFSGTLVHNTWIFGRIESMNVWYRPLDGSEARG